MARVKQETSVVWKVTAKTGATREARLSKNMCNMERKLSEVNSIEHMR